jgi:iron complex outermembrane receptor protein
MNNQQNRGYSVLRLRLLAGGTALALFAFTVSAQAQDATPATVPMPAAVNLPTVTVTAPAPVQTPPVSPVIEKFALPQTRESIDQKKIADTVNIVDTEDAIKYMPSLFVRKRNNGDTQPTIETRTTGINASARTLVYVDDVLISALISNNNTTGAPRWGMVSPEQIKGVDFLYGPFAAAYPGNSMGGVLLITTRMPEKFEATARQTEAFQSFDMYKTSNTYATSESAATVGGKQGRLSFFLSGNLLDSWSQPLQFITTTAANPAGTTGTILQTSKTGTPANVVGAGGLLHSTMTNVNLKLALDVTDWLRASYSIGYWDNNTNSSTQTYLTNASGNQTFGGVSGFASNTYNLYQQHLMNAVSLKSDTGGKWDFEAVATWYTYLQDLQRNPAGVLGGTNFTTNGLIARLDGTGWSTQDLKGIWRPTGPGGAHEVSFGLHHDLYSLNNPTYNTPNWQASSNTGNNTMFTDGVGKTETYGLWVQDQWKLTPGVALTLGGRLEKWRAFDGYNFAGTVGVFQPTEQSTNFSPKASLSVQLDPAWTGKLSFGQANRYPTVSELYQIVSTGPIFSVPNPNLQPESVSSVELAFERLTANSRLRLSFFGDQTANALISQTSLVNNAFVTTFQNVSLTRDFGVEFVAEVKNAFIPGLTLSNSITYVKSNIVSDPGFQSATGSYATGMWVPYVPDWRDTAQVIYSPNEQLSFAAAARFQGKMYSTLDNSDYVSNVMGSFNNFFVFDAHIRYQVTNAISADIGIDNITDAKYFEFHPFPGRTYLASLKLKL